MNPKDHYDAAMFFLGAIHQQKDHPDFDTKHADLFLKSAIVHLLAAKVALDFPQHDGRGPWDPQYCWI